ESVESMQAPVPTSILPEPVVASVTKAYPQATIMKVEKERGNFEIKLNNMMELVVNPTGKIIGQKMDD
ncbi:MAG: PepSY-like domain-containing protein, partial [Spirochaetales bacterium]|nr:PepSY-like domain-containing protein [Spirochaetales bacterium]